MMCHDVSSCVICIMCVAHHDGWAQFVQPPWLDTKVPTPPYTHPHVVSLTYTHQSGPTTGMRYGRAFICMIYDSRVCMCVHVGVVLCVGGGASTSQGSSMLTIDAGHGWACTHVCCAQPENCAVAAVVACRTHTDSISTATAERDRCCCSWCTQHCA